MNYLTIDEGVFITMIPFLIRLPKSSMLDFLGYGVDRRDGYFSQMTKEALISFQTDRGVKLLAFWMKFVPVL